jgi:hypothetical protein
MKIKTKIHAGARCDGGTTPPTTPPPGGGGGGTRPPSPIQAV